MLLYTNKPLSGRKLEKQTHLQLQKKNLGINLTVEEKDLYSETYERNSWKKLKMIQMNVEIHNAHVLEEWLLLK